jgi:hypothetical protein
MLEFIESTAHLRAREPVPPAASLQALELVHCTTEASIGRSVRAEDSIQSVGLWYGLYVIGRRRFGAASRSRQSWLA